MVKCIRCEEYKSLSNFYKDLTRLAGHNPRCKPCANAVNLASKTKKHGSKKAFYRYHWLKYKYGISQEDYESLAESQDWLCAICKNKSKLYIDHCHHTGKIRGLLCNKCNSAVGRMGDTIELVKRVLLYLEKS